MTITGIISAIGNNSSIYPLIVRDCCIEAPAKILIARKENLKESREIANDATREKTIDEYATSAVWLGGIPVTEALADKFIRKSGFSPKVNLNLFKEDKKSSQNVLQGIEYNINKFKNIQAEDVQNAVADLIKAKNNKSVYEKLLAKKFFAATIIPTVIMGFILPPLNFAITRRIRKNKAQDNTFDGQTPKTGANIDFTSAAVNNFKKQALNKDVSFTGNFVSAVANLRTVDKMAISDGGLTVGRVSTSRNKEEGYVNAFRMIGSIILNFVTPVYIAKGLDKAAEKLFRVNVNLDPLILGNEEFIKAIKAGNIELPKSNSPKDLMKFIDEKPDSLFCRFAKDMKKVFYLKSGFRDPRKYVDLEDLGKFKDEFIKFIKAAQNAENIEKFAKKAKAVKCLNVLANVGISSFLLAGVLPKLQYEFNKLVTGSYLDPGLVVQKQK